MGENTVVHLIKLPLRVKAFTMQDSEGNFVIALNKDLTYEMQQEAYLHELRHIEANDFSNVINVDTTEYLRHTEG